MFKFVNDALDPLEIEIGFAKNELVSVATRAAIDLAIVDLIKKGEKKKMWKFKKEQKKEEPAPKPQQKKEEPNVINKRDKSVLSRIKR